MKRCALTLLFLSLPLAAVAQQQNRDPAAPPASAVQAPPKDLEACRADIRRYCDAVHLKQECLVAHWMHISDSCQSSLATPMRAGGE
jgi:hypothetical protein